MAYNHVAKKLYLDFVRSSLVTQSYNYCLCYCISDFKKINKNFEIELINNFCLQYRYLRNYILTGVKSKQAMTVSM